MFAPALVGQKIDKEILFGDLGYSPHSGQWPVHRSEARRRVCAMGVRFGKTTLAAYEAIAWSLAPCERAVGWVVAPTYELSTRVFREIVHVYLSKMRGLVLKYSEHDHMLLVHNLSGGTCEIRGKSADAPVSLLGEGLSWLVVDEFARLKPEIWERYLSQRLVDKDGEALLISTPRGKGLFHELWRRGQPGKDSHFESWNMPSWDNPLLDRSLIEAERGRIPQSVFDQEFGAAWIEGAGSVFRHVRERATGEWSEPVAGRRYIGGLDLAKVEDSTVLVIVDALERRVVFVDRFNRVDWSVQCARIGPALERYNKAHVLVDSTGVGEPVYEKLKEGGVRAEPYQFTAASKAALINNLALMLEQGRVTLPREWSVGIEELESYEFSITEKGNVSMNAPPGQHDDCVIGLALAMWKCRKDQAASVIRWV